MSAGISGLGRLIQRDMKQILRSGTLNTAPVTLYWEEPAVSGGEAADPNIEGSGPELTTVSGVWPALVHFVGPATTRARMFAEIQVGDVICDFDGETPLDGKARLRFQIENDFYVQKAAGGELTRYWDTVIGGRRMTRTVLLTRVTPA